MGPSGTARRVLVCIMRDEVDEEGESGAAIVAYLSRGTMNSGRQRSGRHHGFPLQHSPAPLPLDPCQNKVAKLIKKSICISPTRSE